MLNKLLIRLSIVIFISTSIVDAAKFREGHLTLKQVTEASKIIANASPYKKIAEDLSGTVINIDNKKYEIRYFTFSDVRFKLSKRTTFKKYIYRNKLANLRSFFSSPIDNIYFETFDYRMTNLEDGVLFSLSLKLIDDQN